MKNNKTDLKEKLNKMANCIRKAADLNEPELEEECRFLCDYIGNTIIKSDPRNADQNHKKAGCLGFNPFKDDVDDWFEERLGFHKGKSLAVGELDDYNT